jgi:hypothetical protein
MPRIEPVTYKPRIPPTVLRTDREDDKKDVLDDISSTYAANAHSSTPRVPIMTCLFCLMSPTAEALVQPKSPIAINVMAVASFEIGKPITRDIYKCSDTSTEYASCDQYNPHLTCIHELLQMPEYPAGASV